jgi:phosphopantothenoylcysteine decarboxylase/phosphopantothenate--cysteine ligase
MNLLLCVTGGIAAYKSCELVSLARKAGWAVRVAMTPNATRFVSPITFQALSGAPIYLDVFQDSPSGDIDHIAWAQWADVTVAAPATANLIGKLACGIADDAVTTLLMAVPSATPVLLAPAMNTHMWLNPVTQRNMGWLADLGRFHVVGPVTKRLACGDEGPGGMADPEDVLQAARRLLAD